MTPRFSHPVVGIHANRIQQLLGACLLLAVVGCGGDGRQAVSGDVTMDGQPLSDGIIRFEPQAGIPGSGAGTAIVDGRFQLMRLDSHAKLTRLCC